jgi:phosphonate transport system substrate-binding protein
MRFQVTRVFSLLLVVVTLLLLAGCPGGKEASNARKTEEKVASKDSFVIALLPRENIFYQKRRYKPLAEYLSKALGINVKTKLLDSYEAVYREMRTNKVDAAFFGGLSYVVMDSKIGINPVARLVHKDGRSTYHGVIFGRVDKEITGDISTWKGKRIALVSESTTSGYLFPRWYLHKEGVNNFNGYFGRVFYIGSHDGTIRAVMDNKADIGCSSGRILDRFLVRNPAARKDLVILARSGTFPSDTLGIRTGSLDTKRSMLLKEVLLHMDGTDDGRSVLSFMRAARFIETGRSDYDGIQGMMSDLGLGPDFFGLGGIGRNSRGRGSGRP